METTISSDGLLALAALTALALAVTIIAILRMIGVGGRRRRP